jgi:hypothetical protein
MHLEHPTKILLQVGAIASRIERDIGATRKADLPCQVSYTSTCMPDGEIAHVLPSSRYTPLLEVSGGNTLLLLWNFAYVLAMIFSYVLDEYKCQE